MDAVDFFDSNVDSYEAWFAENKWIFRSEVEAIRQLLPASGKGIEIGAGSGLFAEALGIRFGIEPSVQMRKRASERGINVCDGFAEALPVPDETYDFALMVTVDCFLKDIVQAFAEARRILCENGFFIIAFIDRESPLGTVYDRKKESSVFYRQARFHSAREIKQYLNLAGFTVVNELQTVFNMENRVQEVRQGNGEGGFAVVKAKKKSRNAAMPD